MKKDFLTEKVINNVLAILFVFVICAWLGNSLDIADWHWFLVVGFTLTCMYYVNDTVYHIFNYQPPNEFKERRKYEDKLYPYDKQKRDERIRKEIERGKRKKGKGDNNPR